MPAIVPRLGDLLSAARTAARPRSRIQALIPRGPRRTVGTFVGEQSVNVNNAPLLDGSDPHPDDIRGLADAHDGLLFLKLRHYFDVYSEILEPYRSGFRAGASTRPLRFLEIGVFKGGSQQLWRSYFGPDAVIFGIDIDPSCADLVPPDVSHVRIGSQADPDFLRGVVQEMGGVDVVLDDGSHLAEHQQATWHTLWPLLSDGGLYICEDTHTAYWGGYGGGLRVGGTAIENAKDLVDDMHRWYFTETDHPTPFRPAHPDVWSVSFYDSVLAIRKRARTEEPAMIVRGA